jgi:hypothetical protein
VGTQHLVLHLELVERVEKPVSIEERGTNAFRVKVKRSDVLEELPFRVRPAHRLPPSSGEHAPGHDILSTDIRRSQLGHRRQQNTKLFRSHSEPVA